MLKPDCQGESRSVRTYSIARHHEAGVKAASRFCDGEQFMAKQDTNRRDDNAEPVKLHSPRDLAADGTPRMTGAMEAYICRPHDRVKRPDSEDVRLDDLQDAQREAALTRLQVEHARLYGVLFLTDIRKLSLRATGRHLGMDHHTIVKHRRRAIGLIRAWSTDERQAG